MGFSIGGHCPTHGEIDMDDRLAYCEECYETIGKTELATLRAKVAELEKDRERLAILDAHRTRWYLDQETDHATYFSCFDLRGRFHTLTELADALIDAAMAQGERTNGD